jgi:hypothetical protein
MICGAIISTAFIILGFWAGIRWSVRQDFHEWHEQFKNEEEKDE